MQLNPIPFHVNVSFSVLTTKKRIVIEHSSMGNMKLCSPLYDDAADVGLALYNPDSGVTTRWFMHQEKYSSDDLDVTIFKPCTETLRTQPQLAGWELHVLND